MEFLQKAQDCTLHDYGHSPPTVQNLQLLLRAHLVNYWGLVQNDCQTAPTTDCYRVCQAPL